jgi:hypothetical protein
MNVPVSKRWLQIEAAEILRCSPATITRLRLSRKIAYFSGRPVTIAHEDLEAYVASAKVRRVKSSSNRIEYISAGGTPKPFNLLTIVEAGIKFDCEPRHVRPLCLKGHVPYLPSRPLLIDEADLAECFENQRAAELAKLPPAPGTREFEMLKRQEVVLRARRHVRRRAIRREVARIMAARKAREPK